MTARLPGAPGPSPTARVRFRRWTLADGAVFSEVVSAPPPTAWWRDAVDRREDRRSLHRLLRRCAAMPAGLGAWAVIARAHDAIIGAVMLQPAQRTTGVELGYEIAPAARGRGYATEAAAATIRYGLGVLAADRIVAAIHPRNRASRRVADKVGLRPTGTMSYDGTAYDLYAIERPP